MADLITAVDLKNYLGRTISTDQAEVAVTKASAEIRRLCGGWVIAPAAEVTEKLNGNGTTKLFLKTLYLTAVTTVTIDGVDVSDELDDTIQWSEAGVIWRRDGWSRNYRGNVITYTHGFDEVPEEVAGVCKALAARYRANPTGAVQDSVDGISSTNSLGLLPIEEQILASYTIPGAL